MNCARLSVSLLAAVLGVATLIAPARAGERGFGPEFGNNTITSEIQSLTDREDVDEFVAELVPGERFQAKVKQAKDSDVLLEVAIIDPSGDDRTDDANIKSKKGGKKVTLKWFTVDELGPWTVRLIPIGRTEGAYSAKFKVKAPPTIKLKKRDLAGTPDQETHSFGAMDRTRVNLLLKWRKKDTPVQLEDLSGPAGVVSGIFGEDDAAITLKKSTARLNEHLLDAGDGNYDLTLGIPNGSARYSVAIKLQPPARASGVDNITAVNDPHLDSVSSPVRSAAGQPITITGRNFSINPVPTVFFGPFEAEVLRVGGDRSTIDVVVPPGDDGALQDLIVVNPDNQSAFHTDYIIYVAEAVIDDVAIVSGPVINGNEITRLGGNVLEVTGRNFLPIDTATVGGVPVTRNNATATSYRVTVPPGQAGLADLQHTDEFGRVQIVPGVVRRVGFDNGTTTVVPAGSPVDDFSAWDLAVGDLDVDGREDDVVIVTYNRNSRAYPGYFYDGLNWHDVFDNPIGSRTEYTRVFISGAGGVLQDRTDSNIPDAGTDSTTFGDWNARAVALGDVDGSNGVDLILGGSNGNGDLRGAYPEVLMMRNSGGGSFSLQEAWSPPQFSLPLIVAVDENYTVPGDDEDPDESTIHNITEAGTMPSSISTIAVGDVDGDGDNDVVAGWAGFGYRYAFFEPGPVRPKSPYPYYIHTSELVVAQEGRYYSGTRVFDNDIDTSGGFLDVTATAVPSVGIVGQAVPLPAFPARSLALGDVDNDTDLDVVLTYNNPAQVLPISAATSYGYYRRYTYGTYNYVYAVDAQPVVATRVLINDGTGTFTDGTATWMPAGAGVEFWQAHKVVLHDLDGDLDLDVILIHRRALNEWKAQAASYSRSSLRILENTGTAFVDVTTSALPAVPGGSAGVFRGRAIAVTDIDLDGNPDLIVGTDEALADAGGTVNSTRILWGAAGIAFSLQEDYVFGTDADTGEGPRPGGRRHRRRRRPVDPADRRGPACDQSELGVLQALRLGEVGALTGRAPGPTVRQRHATDDSLAVDPASGRFDRTSGPPAVGDGGRVVARRRTDVSPNLRMTTRHRSLALTAAALPLADVAHGADAVGPPIGRNRYKTHIADGPQGDDTDDYVVALFAGESLKATVKANFQSGLSPLLSLVDPDGQDRSVEAGLPSGPLQKKVKLRRFTVDKTGLWAVRVSGLRDSEGPYTISFSIRSPGKTKSRGNEFGGAFPDALMHSFDAVDGATLSVIVKSARGGATGLPLSLRGPDGDVTGPSGSPFADEVTVRRRKARLSKLLLDQGNGKYERTVGSDGDSGAYDLTLSVRPPQRASSRKPRELSKVEPHLPLPQNGPLRGIEGTRMRLDGWNFSPIERPAVFFGSRRGLDPLVDPTGGFLEVTAPAPLALGLVSVSVVNPDGQGSVSEDHFEYVIPAEVTDLTDLAGTSVRGGSTAGGRRLRLTGDHFETGHLVRFGEQNAAVIPLILSPTLLEVTAPPGDPGLVQILVVDSFRQEGFSPFDYEYKVPPQFGAAPYAPPVAPTDGSRDVIVSGQAFSLDDVLLFDGQAVPFLFGTENLLSFTPPALPDGEYDLVIEDRYGVRGQAPPLRIKAVGVIDTVDARIGPALSATEVSRHGSTTIRILGSSLHELDSVTIGGTNAAVGVAGSTELQVSAPAGAPGLQDVVVTDALGQSTTATGALRYAGADDATAARTPGRTATDDLGALRAVVGDLDGDGDDDDLALVSHTTSPGTRSERLRVLFGDGAGAWTDETGDAIPDAGTDTTGLDDWSATCVALGDVDDLNGGDLLIAGPSPDTEDVSEFRFFTNDGDGVFSLEEDDAPASLYLAAVVAEDEFEIEQRVLDAQTVDGLPTAMALGDIDDDGDLDVILGRDRHLSQFVRIDPSAVDFGETPPYISSTDAAANVVNQTHYSPATRVLENRIDQGDGFVDVTDAAFPSAGTSADATPSPALVARDVALVDLDGDDDLDVVMTFDDPTEVTPKGLDGTDSARIATRILINDGAGVFTDETSSWLPTGTAPEFFHADRLAFADLDGDDDPDLVLLHALSLDAYQGAAPGFQRSALRVLRNDGDPGNGGSGFTNVSLAVLPTTPVAGNENLRSDALTVGDVTGDGVLDILVGARTAPTNGATSLRALRLLVGTAGTIDLDAQFEFLTPLATDTGQCDDIHLIEDLAGNATPSIVLVSENAPTTGPGAEKLRVADWER